MQYDENIFIDNKTGLMWQDDESVKTTKMTWEEAISYAKNLKFAGYNDWRLPTRLELHSITDKTKYDPAVKFGIKNVSSEWYWSGTLDVLDFDAACAVYFECGRDFWWLKDYSFLVRCVRDSK